MEQKPEKPTEDPVKAAREHGVKTGDWSAYEKLRPQLGIPDAQPGPWKKRR